MSGKKISRRVFASRGAEIAGGTLAASALTTQLTALGKEAVLDAHMHLESYGTYWEGLEDEIIEHYDYARIDRGVVFTAWTPTRESNDRTLAACRKYPDRFIPFGHVRTQDPDWESELERVGNYGWKGIKLHQSEISRGPDLEEKTQSIVKKAFDCGLHVVLIHLEDVEMIDRLAGEFLGVSWIIPHMGSTEALDEMKRYCELAKRRANVFLDTSNAQYHRFGQQIQWAGFDKVLFASDGFWFSPAVEKAKIEILQLPTPFRTPRLTDGEAFSMTLYIGPNDYTTLRAFDAHVEDIIPFGWSLFGTVNRYVIRPIFSFLSGMFSSMGLVILLLTLLVKLVSR